MGSKSILQKGNMQLKKQAVIRNQSNTAVSKSDWLEALVLAVISKEGKGDYAYSVKNKIMPSMHLSETAIYNACKRLKEKQLLNEHDENYDGRNRRYYQITEIGQHKLLLYRKEWIEFSVEMNKLLI